MLLDKGPVFWASFYIGGDMMSKVLSFDQSTKISAYSIFIGGKYTECGVIDLHKMKDTSERVRAMGVELCNRRSGSAKQSDDPQAARTNSRGHYRFLRCS